MSDLDKLSDEEVSDLARHWRREALRGDKNARGKAHEYEVEHRRRVGAVGAGSPPAATFRDVAPLGHVPQQSSWRRRLGQIFGKQELA